MLIVIESIITYTYIIILRVCEKRKEFLNATTEMEINHCYKIKCFTVPIQVSHNWTETFKQICVYAL